MKIRNQDWKETDTHLILSLREPWWGAWKKFNWSQGVEGIGVSREALAAAITFKKKIQVDILKYGSYEITCTKAVNYLDNTFIPRDKRVIIIIPRTAFNRISEDAKVEQPKPQVNQMTLI